jgi:quercetin dioxygenase-like cupin family protein
MRAVKIDYDKVDWKQFRTNTGLHYKPIKMGDLGFSRFLWSTGASEAWHSHAEEPQIVLCLSGRIDFGIRDEKGERVEVVRGGDVLAIEPGVEHMAHCIEETELIVIWSPMNRFNADAIAIC